MPEQTREYTIFLTDVDRLKVRQRRNGHDILGFSVQYEALINSRWRKIVRYDNSHGYPHWHVYYAKGIQYKHIMHSVDNNQAFTEAQVVIKKNFMDMKDRYILSLDRNVGGGEA